MEQNYWNKDVINYKMTICFYIFLYIRYRYKTNKYTTMNNNNVFETVTLPNGGVVQLDKLAFETLDGQCISSHKLNGKYVWKLTLDFNGDRVETASVKPNNVERR